MARILDRGVRERRALLARAGQCSRRHAERPRRIAVEPL